MAGEDHVCQGELQSRYVMVLFPGLLVPRGLFKGEGTLHVIVSYANLQYLGPLPNKGRHLFYPSFA